MKRPKFFLKASLIGLLLVFVAAYLNGPDFTQVLWGLNMKPEHLVNPMVLALLWITHSKTRLFRRVPSILLLAWLILTSASSIYSPNPLKSLILSFEMLLGVTSFFVVILIVRSADDFKSAYWLMLVVGVVEALYGIVAWISLRSGLSFISPNAAGYYALVGPAVPVGTWSETNLFGDFLAPTIILLLGALQIVAFPRKLVYLVITGVCVLGIAVTTTRGAWLSLLISLSLFLLILLGSKRGSKYVLGLVLEGTFILIIVFVALQFFSVGEILLARVASLSALVNDYNFTGRLLIYKTALSAYAHGPIILGSGADSFRINHVVFGGPHDFLHNVFLGALYDSGLLGFLAFTGFLGWLFWSAWRAIRRMKDSKEKIMLIATLAASLALVASGQSNNHSWMSIFWCYLGLLAAGTSQFRRSIFARVRPVSSGSDSSGVVVKQ